MLDNLFSTISEKLKSEHPQENPEFNTINLDDYIKNKIPSKDQFPLMKLADLTSALKSLDVTIATGLDGITPRTLKTSAETVVPTLLDISHEPSSLFHHSVLVDLSVSMMMH